jgi:hypothetical protein
MDIKFGSREEIVGTVLFFLYGFDRFAVVCCIGLNIQTG